MNVKKIDVSSICNALVDILFFAKDSDIQHLNLKKGIMNLVDADKQSDILDFFASRDKTVELGGSSLNTIKALAQLNCKTLFAGMVGDDSLGETVKQKMDDYKITKSLQHNHNVHTGSCIVLVTPDGERTLNTYLGASSLYDSSVIPKDKIASSKVFHFSGYQWDTIQQKEAAIEAIKYAKKSGVIVSFDLADPWVVEKHKKDFVKLIEEDVDIVFANREEGRLLYDASLEETSEKIVENGVVAVLKLDKEGALLKNSTESIKVKAIPTNVVDTTGAGDMFAAGFLYGYIREKDLETCGNIAATLASDVISRMGAQLSAETIEKIVHKYK